MEYSNERIDALKAAVVETFGRTLDAPTDFDVLSSEIQNKTGEAISPSTLKRLYGYIKPATVPRPSTLSTLARYAGFSGWSDFCDRCIEPIASEKRNKRNVLLYATLSGIGICVLAFILWFVWVAPEAQMNPSAGQPISVLKTPEQKAERIKHRCIVLAKDRCDSIRNLRSGMDIITYKETVDNFYFSFVFSELKNSIDEQVSAVFPEDDSLATHYRNEIFFLCREICVELMRGIPADELTKAYREKSDV